MPVIMIGFGLFAMTIFIALGTTMSNSIWPGMIMFWPSSALFITLPVTYCLMFNQKLNASVTSVRRLVSVLEMGNALVGWICFLAIPGEVDENSRYSVIFMWVVTIPLFVLFFSWLLSINKYVRGDFTVDTSVKSVVIGIRSDYRNKEHTGRSLRHIVLFILLLIPAMSLSILGSTLDATSEDVEAPQDPRLVNLLFAFQILIIPLIEVALATTQMREDRADYSILVIAHVTNVLILVLMLTNIKAVPAVTTASDVKPSHQVRIKRGEASDAKRFFCPDPGRITFIMLNGIMYDVEVISSVHFKDTPEIWSIKPGDYVPVNFPVETTKTMSAEVEILIADKSIPKPPEVKGTLEMQVNYFSMMYTYGNASYFSLRQYDNPYKFMKGMARVMYFSTLWLDVPGGTIIISSDDGSYSVKIPVPPKNQMESKFFPVARRMAFTYQFEGDDETAKKILTKDTVEVPLEEFDDYVVYVSDSGSGLSINSLRVCDKPSPVTRTTTTTTTLRPIEAEEQTAYALAGSSLGVTSVAYTHFFWVESPILAPLIADPDSSRI
ncbi:hypothetical protein GE061_013088 [Apolygus lucorum]|uniref:Uncharacterized protein n=1 Tax=Apolygus lucorum TaxID=248454 RepID=A0A8S9XUE4_APOLU|nr:hypothetical protein GE061_013088 [Apolygus lucorum]